MENHSLTDLVQFLGLQEKRAGSEKTHYNS